MATTTNSSAADRVVADELIVRGTLWAVPHPHPVYGPLVGHVFDYNVGWKPSAWLESNRTKECTGAMIQADLDAGRGPANMHRLSKLAVSLRFCQVVVSGEGIPENAQCGHVYQDDRSFMRHLRTHHTGCFLPVESGPPSEDEKKAFRTALVAAVLWGRWRDTHFVHPVGPLPGSEIWQIAQDLEERAAQDPQWGRQYGTVFHRAPVVTAAPSPAAVRSRQAQRLRRVPEVTERVRRSARRAAREQSAGAGTSDDES